jgi:hypothetical protein
VSHDLFESTQDGEMFSFRFLLYDLGKKLLLQTQFENRGSSSYPIHPPHTVKGHNPTALQTLLRYSQDEAKLHAGITKSAYEDGN